MILDDNIEKTALSSNKIPYPIMFSAKEEANETGLSIIYKDKILQSFK